MYVRNASAFICEPVEDFSHMKDELKKYTDYFFRRINKFIMLSLMGVHQCVHGFDISKSAAVYLSTENGNLGDTENVLRQIYRENSFPKPFNFINTMSNTASFYVAQSLKTLGRSITVSSRNVSFERGLELARTDLELKYISEALIGGVDEAVFSRRKFEEKYDSSYHSAKLVEGSSWLYCSMEKEGALGEITDISTFKERKNLNAWIERNKAENTVVSFGILMDPSEKESVKKEAGFSGEFNYISEHGYYDTSAAFAVCWFFMNMRNRNFIHINRDIRGQYVCVSCRSF